MNKTYLGPWRGYDGGNLGRFVVRDGRRYFEFTVKPNQIQLSIDLKYIEKMQQDEWDYDNEQRSLRMKGKK